MPYSNDSDSQDPDSSSESSLLNVKYLLNMPESPLFHLMCLLLCVSTFVPQRSRTCKGLSYSLLALAYFMAAIWVYMTHFGLTVFFVFFVLTSLCFVQTLYVLYHNKQTNLSPSFDKLYMELFQPLKMPLREYKQLVQDPDVRLRSMSPGETYAIEGVSVPDQLSLLVSGCVHVLVEGRFVHKIDEFSFLDSPEWESFCEEFPEHFQVTLTAVRHSTYISWPRKVLEAILYESPYLNAIMTNLIGRDITNKLYILNQQAANNQASISSKHSAKELRSIWSDASKTHLNSVSAAGSVKKPETGSLTALREMRSTERQNTFGDSIYGSMGDSFDELKRNNSMPPAPGLSCSSSSSHPYVVYNQYSFPPFTHNVSGTPTPTHSAAALNAADTSCVALPPCTLNYPPNHYPYSPFTPTTVTATPGSTNSSSSRHPVTGGRQQLCSQDLKEAISSASCMLQSALANLSEALANDHNGGGSLVSPPSKVASSEAVHCRSNVSTSRAITPYTTSTESEPNNLSFSQNSPPNLNMKMSSEDDAVLTITVPLSEKGGLTSYDSPNMEVSSSNSQRRRYGDYQQSTSSSTEPSVSLDEEAALSARRRVRPLLRSKQIITEEDNHHQINPVGVGVGVGAIAGPAAGGVVNTVVFLSDPLTNSTEECIVQTATTTPSSSSAPQGGVSCSEPPVTLKLPPVAASAALHVLSEDTHSRPSHLPVIIEPEIVINPGTPTPEDQDSDLEYKWWTSLTQDSIDDPHYFVSLADMTGLPHSNHTTIEEDEMMTSDATANAACLQTAVLRRGSCSITDCIDLESMESDLLDPLACSEIDELLKKAAVASSLASSRTSQTSEESPKQGSEGEVSPGPANLVASGRKNSIGIQVCTRRSPKMPPQLSVDSGGSSSGGVFFEGGDAGLGVGGCASCCSSSAGASFSTRKAAKMTQLLNQFNLGHTLDSSLSDSMAASVESDLNSAQSGSHKRNSLSAFSRQNTLNSDVDLVLLSSRLSRQNSENSCWLGGPASASCPHNPLLPLTQAAQGQGQGSQNSLHSPSSSAFSPIIPEEEGGRDLCTTDTIRMVPSPTRPSDLRGGSGRRIYNNRRPKLRACDRFNSVDTPSITITQHHSSPLDPSPTKEECCSSAWGGQRQERGYECLGGPHIVLGRGERTQGKSDRHSGKHRNSSSSTSGSSQRPKRFLPHGYSLD